MNTLLIKLFNAATPETNTLSFASVNTVAAKVGYFVEPDACTPSVLEFLNEQKVDYNSTFYKDWVDVTSKSRLELALDQILHYCTTYGTGFALGNGYVPNDGAENVPALDFSKYKVIKAISEKDLYTKCLDLLASGIALKQDTMHAVADYVIDYSIKNNAPVNVDDVKNREALIYICDKAGLCPSDKFSLLRYIVYKTTGSEMIIKNAAMIRKIATSSTQFDFSKLNAKQMEALASIFLRYKDIFLAFKHVSKGPQYEYGWHKSCGPRDTASANAPYINKLRKMAVKLHEPMKEGFWQTIFKHEYSIPEIQAHLDELTTYKKVALMQSCIQRASDNTNQLYIVRNQKMFMRKNYAPKATDNYLMRVYAALYASVVETLKKNSTNAVVKTDEATGKSVTEYVPKKIRLVKGMSVALPTSEKSFIGNYPFGTSFKLTDHNYFGIYWRNEWGTHDYDLSFCDVRGSKIGWNSDYYSKNQDVVFSGDMTNAEPEAAEVIYMKNAGTRGIVYVNQFNGEPISKFNFFVGQSNKGLLANYRHADRVGHMVDPNSIVFECQIPVDNQRQVQVGVVTADKVVLMALGAGNSIVSRGNAEVVSAMQDAIDAKTIGFVDAGEMLKAAGYEVVDDTYMGNVDIDFANLDKDSLIALMK